MGCFHSKPNSKSLESSSEIADCKTYSWSNKTMDNRDLILEKMKNNIIIRFPGSVNGQQFIIQNCENCTIYVLDHCNMVTVDDCSYCNIFIGPTKGSVFLRDCSDCRFITASQQFRSRDCKRLDVLLYCATQPIIESCSDMRFGCYTAYYEELEEQFEKAGLNIFNNNWSYIHDFTPAEEGEQNWTPLPKGLSVEIIFQICSEVSRINFTAEPSRSLVPETLGHRRGISREMCFAIFFHDDHSQMWAVKFIDKMTRTDNILVQTKQCTLRAEDGAKIFGSDSFSQLIRRGPIIIMVYDGESCLQSCHDALKIFPRELFSPDLVHITSRSSMAHSQLQVLLSSCDIQMSA